MSSVYIERVVSVIDSSPNSQAQKPPPDVCVEVCSTGSVLAGTVSAYWRIAVGGIPKPSKLRAAAGACASVSYTAPTCSVIQLSRRVGGPVRPAGTCAENAAGFYQDLLWPVATGRPDVALTQPL